MRPIHVIAVFAAGTPGYLAPEVADGHEGRAASDVFSLAATLFAAIEGVSPQDLCADVT